MLTANIAAPDKGFVLDYVVLNTGQNNFTFQGDKTYYISGNVTLGGTTTIEGGAVIKYAPGKSIVISGSVACQTSQYRPAIFTAVDDDTVGEWISGYSTGAPLGYYANNAVKLPTSTGSTLSNLRFLYAQTANNASDALNTYATISDTFKHIQVLSCSNAIIAVGNASAPQQQQALQGIQPASGGGGGGSSYPRSVFLGNILISNVVQAVSGSICSVVMEQVTLDHALTIATGSTVGLTVYNSVFAGTVYLTRSGFEHFRILQWILCHADVWQSYFHDFGSPFQASGAGYHYLATSSGFQQKGTASINAQLLGDLKTRTTQPPIALPAMMELSGNLTLFPQSPRYTSGSPDLGYYYDALDYTVATVLMDTGNITVLPGTAIGVRNDELLTPDGYSWTIIGFRMGSGSSFNSQGFPNKPNIFTTTEYVQEAPIQLLHSLSTTLEARSPAFILSFQLLIPTTPTPPRQ